MDTTMAEPKKSAGAPAAEAEVTMHGVEGLFEKVVTKFGTGAKIDCPKKYLGRAVYVVVPRESPRLDLADPTVEDTAPVPGGAPELVDSAFPRPSGPAEATGSATTVDLDATARPRHEPDPGAAAPVARPRRRLGTPPMFGPTA